MPSVPKLVKEQVRADLLQNMPLQEAALKYHLDLNAVKGIWSALKAAGLVPKNAVPGQIGAPRASVSMQAQGRGDQEGGMAWTWPPDVIARFSGQLRGFLTTASGNIKITDEATLGIARSMLDALEEAMRPGGPVADSKTAGRGNAVRLQCGHAIFPRHGWKGPVGSGYNGGRLVKCPVCKRRSLGVWTRIAKPK